jgi:hypothetical protein
MSAPERGAALGENEVHAEAIVVLLSELLAAVQRLPEELARARLRPASDLSAQDRAKLERVLPAISMFLGDMTFSTKDLLSHAADDRELHAAVEFACGPSKGAARKLGMLLARGAGHKSGGFTVYKNGRARDGDLWMVKNTDREFK